ncbi:MAG: FtsX-like permease family protein, partial [Vulcanimicrobiaceae bacterium]
GDPFSGEILRVIGIDLLRPLPRARPQGAGIDPFELVAGRGAIVSSRIAGRYHLRVGSRLDALAGDRAIALRVAGILPADSVGVDSSVVFVDIVTAQELFGKVGLLDRIDCVVDPARVPVVQAAIARVIPPGARVVAPTVRTHEIQRMLRSFQLNLAALSYIALLVGMYLIYNTVAISVVQRRAEIGTVRAVGTTRRQIFATFLAEGILFGVAGALLGLVLGSLLAHFSVAAVSRTVDALYVGTHADGVHFELWPLVRAFAVGVLSAALSALAPALEAADTPPAITMRGAGFESRTGRPNYRWLLAGIGLLVAAAAATSVPAIGGIPVFGYLAGLLIIFGASLCVPTLVRATARLSRVHSGLPAEGRLGIANLGASPRRTSVAVASLMVAIGMMVAVAILIGSFRTTVVAWADQTLKADLFVRPLGLADASYDARFPPAAVRRVRSVPGVAAVDTFRAVTLPFRGSLVTLGAADFRSFAARDRLQLLAGLDATAISRRLPDSDEVLASEPFARRYGVRVGDRIRLPTAVGPREFTVAAIYNDYSSDAGVVIVDRRTFARLFHDATANSLAIYAQPGVDLAALRTRIVRSLAPRLVDVETNRELRSLVIALFDRTFAITYALYIISITIAVLGVVSTLFALVLERRREIGLLRYLGLATGGVRAMVLYEAAGIGLLGGTTGVGLGVLLALLLIYVINPQAFGWLITLRMPYGFLIQTIVLVVVAALLAGLYPASVAARIRTADAVRTE